MKGLKGFFVLLLICLTSQGLAEERHPHPPPPDGPPLYRWMQHLRHREPETFEAMQKLRSENPDAFRDAMHLRLGFKRLHRILADFPSVAQAVEQLDKKEREKLVQALFASPDPKHQPNSPRRMNDRHFHENNLRKLIGKYQETSDDQEREELRQRIHAYVDKSFEQKSRQRHENMEQLRRRIKELDSQLEKWESTREETIKTHIDRLINPIQLPLPLPDRHSGVPAVTESD